MRKTVSFAVVGAILALAAQPAAAQVKRTIRLSNVCRSPIEFVIRHADNGANWHSHGWYKLAPGESSTFEASGVVLQQEEGMDLYVYARATDGSNKVWSGNNRQSFGEATYPFMTMATAVGDTGALIGSFSCD